MSIKYTYVNKACLFHKAYGIQNKQLSADLINYVNEQRRS
jgi:hypothetical protein